MKKLLAVTLIVGLVLGLNCSAFATTTMYAPDGRIEYINDWEVDLWKKVGWFTRPCTTYYYPDSAIPNFTYKFRIAPIDYEYDANDNWHFYIYSGVKNFFKYYTFLESEGWEKIVEKECYNDEYPNDAIAWMTTYCKGNNVVVIGLIYPEAGFGEGEDMFISYYGLN